MSWKIVDSAHGGVGWLPRMSSRKEELGQNVGAIGPNPDLACLVQADLDTLQKHHLESIDPGVLKKRALLGSARSVRRRSGWRWPATRSPAVMIHEYRLHCCAILIEESSVV